MSTPDSYWLRPYPGAPISGPYTEAEARERAEDGTVAWPQQQMYTGPHERKLTPAVLRGPEQIAGWDDSDVIPPF